MRPVGCRSDDLDRRADDPHLAISSQIQSLGDWPAGYVRPGPAVERGTAEGPGHPAACRLQVN
jgi:hypothetical protein